MVKKNWIQISIILLIAILLSTQGMAAVQESLRDVTPDKPIIFYQLTGAGSVINTNSNFWKQMKQAPFWEIVYAELEARSKVKGIHLGIKPGASLLSHLFGEDIVFVLPQFEAIPEISPLLMLRLKDSDDELGALIVSSIEIALANVAQTTSQYGGYTINVIPLPPPAPFGIACALMDDVFAVGLGDTTLRKVIDLLNGSGNAKPIMEDDKFSSIMERLPVPANSRTGQYSGVFHLNLAKVVAFGSSMYPLIAGNLPEPMMILGQALKWLDIVPSISWTAAITDEGLSLQSYAALNPDATSQNFLDMLRVEPEPLGSIAFVPEDAVGYSGTNLIDLKRIWRMAYNTMADLPDMGRQVLAQLEGIEKGYGINFEEDVFSWMGNEVGYIYSDNPMFSGQRMRENICLIIKVADRKKAQQGLQKLADLASRLSEGKLKIQQRKYMGETIYEPEELPIPVKPGYALVNDYLLLSPSTAYLQKLMDCAAGRAKGLNANPRFQAVKDRYPEKANGMEFFDTRRWAEVLMADVKAGMGEEIPASGGMTTGAEQDMQMYILPQVFELVDLLSKAFGASAGFTLNDGTGLKSMSFMQIRDLEEVLPISDPDDAKIARNLYIANRYKEAEMLNRAAERYMQVLEMDPDNWQALMGAVKALTEQGRVQEAKVYQERMGFVPEDSWYVIGPFENELGEGFGTQYAPEKEFNLDAEYEVAGGAVTARWEKLTDDAPDGFVDFLYIFEPDQWAVAYAWTKVISEETREAQLRTGSDDQMMVWLNGKEVVSRDTQRTAEPDQDIVTVTLNQGENQLLVKVCNEELDWGFYIRFTEADGRPLEGLKFGE